MAVSVLGGLTVTWSDGSEASLPTRKTALVLGALAALGEAGAPREALAEWIWPDRSEGQARTSLRSALAALRKALPDILDGGELEAGRDRLRLLGPEEAIDVRRFETLCRSRDAADLAAAAAVYRGDLLDGVEAPEAFEQQLAARRQGLRRQAMTLVEALSQESGLTAEQAAACEALANRLLAGDPAAEPAHRAIIRLRLAAGETNAARRQLELCAEAVRRELGAEPEPATRALLDAPAAPPKRSAASVLATPSRPTPRDRGGRPSIAVMPFDGIGLAQDDVLVDGVVEEITSALSRVRDFFVIARQSAYAYKGRFVDVREVGRELGVRYVVEGTVRRGGDRVRITVQLVETEHGAQLWSDRYEGNAADLFDLQDSIASHVAGAISPSIRSSEIELAKHRPSEDQRAYDLFLRAFPHFWAHSKADNAAAVKLLDEALALDPEFGAAMAFNAWAHAQQAVYLWGEDPARERALAIESAQAAARRVGDNPMALVAIGAALTQTSADGKLAASFIERALAIDPNNAWGWMRLGWLQVYRDEAAAAVGSFERAFDLSPFDPFRFNVCMGLAAAYDRLGDLPRAIELAEEGVREGPSASWVLRMLASYYVRAGRAADGAAAMRRFLENNPGATIERMKASSPPLMLSSNPDYWEGLRRAGMPER